MPRVRPGSVLRALVVLALLAGWLQLMLSASQGPLYSSRDVHINTNPGTSEYNEKSIAYPDINIITNTGTTATPKHQTVASSEFNILTNTGTTATPKHQSVAPSEELMNANETSEQVLALVPPELHKYLTVHHKNVSANSTERAGPRNITEIRRAIERYNEAQTIINEDIFGPVQNDTLIVAIQRPKEITEIRRAIERYEAQTIINEDIFGPVQNDTLIVAIQVRCGGCRSSCSDPLGYVQRPKEITEIRRAIERYNEAQTIINEDIYGPVQNDTLIVAIQVHTRLTYLRHLIVSLAQARDIDRTLLIFSHDYYDEEINNLVRSIDFTKVMQIFYPHSIQTHPYEYPGTDPRDCPRDAKFEQAVKLKCLNALHPDLHGHYREAKYTQTKHHWWWKANRIFNQLQCTIGHTGLVVFLEEDHYVAEDFIHMLGLLRSTADKSCPQCEILSLGTYLKTYQYHVNGDRRKKQLTLNYIQQVKAANEERRRRMQDTQTWNFQVYPNLYSNTQKVEITPWHSSMHNMGFAFNRTVWNNIMQLEQQFCAYDDYNWDYSLLHLSQNRPGREKFVVILCKGPRVFHIGECGFHHKKSNCNASTVISKVQKLLQNARAYMFPNRVTASVTSGGAKHNKKLTKGNGGWGDIRDQELCTNMTKIGRQMKKYFYYA